MVNRLPNVVEQKQAHNRRGIIEEPERAVQTLVLDKCGEYEEEAEEITLR
jgi:hypothetical protein